MALPSSGQLGGTPTNAQFQTYIEAFRDVVSNQIGGAGRYELTIASGAVTPPARDHGGVFRLDTEGNAASDTLDTITQTNTPDGTVIVVMAEDAARVVTLNHAAGGAGQILLTDSTDFVFASLNAWVMLQRRSTDWVEMMRYVPLADLASVVALTSSDIVRVYDASAAGEKSTPATQLGHIVQEVEATPYTSYNNISPQIPADDTIPQNSEGVELVTASITPKSSTNRLRIRASFSAAVGATGAVACALFQDSTANAIASRFLRAASDDVIQFEIEHEMAAGTTSAITFKLRAGPGAAALNLYINGSTSARLGGGTQAVRMRITEYAA